MTLKILGPRYAIPDRTTELLEIIFGFGRIDLRAVFVE